MSNTEILIQIGDEVRPMNDQELEQYKLDQEMAAAKEDEIAKENAEKQAAKKALLEKLGLTEDEAKLLLA